MSTRAAIIMKQISIRNLLSSHVSFVMVILGLLVFLGPPVLGTLWAEEDVEEFGSIVEDKDWGVAVCISAVGVGFPLKSVPGRDVVLSSVMF